MASPLNVPLGHLLRDVADQATAAFAAKLAPHRLSVAAWLVLRELLYEDAATVRVLAKDLGMTRGVVARLIRQLGEEGLVVATEAPAERGQPSLALSPKGRALIPTLALLAEQNDREFFGRLGDERRELIEAALQEIILSRRFGIPTPRR